VATTAFDFVATSMLVAATVFELSTGWLYGVLLLEASSRAIGWTARAALLPQLLPEEEFAGAASWNSMAFQIAAVVGPAVGGAMAWVGTSWAFAAAMGLQLASLMMMSKLQPTEGRRSSEPATLRTLLGGVRFVWKTPL